MPDSLPPIPAPRIAYDIDGTQHWISPINGGSYSLATLSQTQTLNNENPGNFINNSGSSGSTSGQWTEHTFVFPEARDIKGLFINTGGSVNVTIYTSTDTTTGSDGTWNNAGAFSYSTATLPNSARVGIQPVNYTALTGLRVRVQSATSNNSAPMYALHMYGETSPLLSTERLEFWDPTLNQVASKDVFNIGDINIGEVSTAKQFRVKNLSSSKTASAVVLSAENAPNNDTGLASGITFSSNGSTGWSPTLDIGNLAPGQVSDIVYMRRIVGGGEPARPRFARVLATPGTYA